MWRSGQRQSRSTSSVLGDDVGEERLKRILDIVSGGTFPKPERRGEPDRLLPFHRRRGIRPPTAVGGSTTASPDCLGGEGEGPGPLSVLARHLRRLAGRDRYPAHGGRHLPRVPRLRGRGYDAYRRVSVRELRGFDRLCVSGARIPAARALFAYVRALRAWDVCIERLTCDSPQSEEKRQREWRIAYLNIRRAERNLDR